MALTAFRIMRLPRLNAQAYGTGMTANVPAQGEVVEVLGKRFQVEKREWKFDAEMGANDLIVTLWVLPTVE